MRVHASVGGALLLSLVALAGPASAQSKHLAPGFSALSHGSRVAIMPTDIELYSISAGGVLEPKADWTEAATLHFRNALIEKKKKALKLDVVEVSERTPTSSPISTRCTGPSRAPSPYITSGRGL